EPMFETAQSVELTNLTDQIDELSTRLIIDGVKTLGAEDFERLSQTAATLGNSTVAEAAMQIAKQIAPPCNLAIPDLTRLLSTGLVDMRKFLDDPSAERPAAEAAVQAVVPVATHQVEAAVAIPSAPAINP